jgi:hypothetical protein
MLEFDLVAEIAQPPDQAAYGLEFVAVGEVIDA